MNIKPAIKVTLTASALTFATASLAANGWNGKWVNNNNTLTPGTTLQSIAANSNKNSYTSNPALTNNAWGMQGTWLTFTVTQTTTTLITATSAPTNAPGFTVYRTAAPFVGDVNATGATSTFTTGAIHGFNQIAQAGEPGIVWATDITVTNSLPGNTTTNGIVETLGYVNASGMEYTNAYGQRIVAGAEDVSIDNLYESGISGGVDRSATSVSANLLLKNLAPGNYTIFLGGTNTSGTNTPIDLQVSSISVSSADCLFNYNEQKNPTLFSPAGATSQTLSSYYYRFYATSKYGQGISSADNHLYYLDPTGKLTDQGAISTLLTQAGCK